MGKQPSLPPIIKPLDVGENKNIEKQGNKYNIMGGGNIHFLKFSKGKRGFGEFELRLKGQERNINLPYIDRVSSTIPFFFFF